MSLIENPEIKDPGAHLRKAQQFLRILRGWKSPHTEAMEKLRALCVGGFETQRTRRELAEAGESGPRGQNVYENTTP